MISMVNKRSEGYVLLLFVVFNCIAFVSNKLFNLYDHYSPYIVGIMVIIFFFKRSLLKSSLKSIAYVVFFAVYALSTLFLTGGGLGSVMDVVDSMLVIIICSEYYLSDQSLRRLIILLVCLSLFVISKSHGYYLKSLYDKTNFINSNTMAQVVMYTCIYVSIFLKKIRHRFRVPVILGLYVLGVWGIFNFQSRGTLSTFLLFIILDYAVPKRFFKNKFRTLLSVGLVLSLGLTFPYVYTTLYNNGVNFSIPFTTKSLYTGRELIWNNFYNSLGENMTNWLFGLGSHAQLWVGHSQNLHNNYLSVIASFGVIGFAMYYGFIFIQIKSVCEGPFVSDYTVSLLIGFLCVLMDGFVEVSTLWDVMLFFNFMFLGLAKRTFRIDSNTVYSGVVSNA